MCVVGHLKKGREKREGKMKEKSVVFGGSVGNRLWLFCSEGKLMDGTKYIYRERER